MMDRQLNDTADRNKKRTSAIVVIATLYIAFIGVGLPNSLLGAAWPSMQTYVDVPASYAGWITLAISLGMFVSSLLSERCIIGLGAHRTMVLSFAFIAASVAGFSLSADYKALLASGAALGVGIGLMEAAANGYVVKHLSSRHMNWMHCFWGVGAAIGPLLMASAIGGGAYRTGYRYAAFVEVAVLLLVIATLSFFKSNEKALSSASEGSEKATGNTNASGETPGQSAAASKEKGKSLAELMARPKAPVAVIAFFLYCSVEMTVMLWGASYMVMAKHIEESAAAGWMSVFFVGMVVGRVAAGAAAVKMGNKKLIAAGLAISALSVAVILAASSVALLSAGFFALGFGFGPVFPSLLHATSDNFEEEYAQAMVGAQLASAFLGNAIIPLIFGALAGTFGYGLFPFTLIMLLALLVLASWALFKRPPGRPRP
ncbi:MAG: MFS transporter [Clostridiales Family XIII bacterium]|nr:MFS transporter [Clostridiales Family XIII bacterium]